MADWYYDSTAVGTGAGTSWTNARTSLQTMTSVVAGENIYVAHTHAEAPGANITINFPGTTASLNRVICVNKAGTVPPVSADWRTTGSVGATGAFSISVNGSAYIYGLTFNAGIGSASSGVTVNITGATGGGTVGHYQHYDNCVFRISSTSTSNSCRVNIGSSGTNVGCRTTLTNTSFHFADAAHNISPNSGQIEWRATPFPFLSIVPNTMVLAYGTPVNWVFEGINFNLLSAKTFFSGVNTHFRAAFYGCLVPGGTMTTAITHPGAEIYISNSGIATPFISKQSRYSMEGSELTDTTVARAGGATDGTPFSRSYFTATASPLGFKPYVGLPFVMWNDATITNLTLTVYGIWCNSQMPYNTELWLETQYFGDTFAANRSPLMVIDHNSAKPNYQVTASQFTADTSDWTAGTVALRANSTVYGTRQLMKVASNPGRLFYNQNTGSTTAASEPAGYATAIDGGTVIDGACVFRACPRFKMTITLSAPQPQLPGPLYVFPKMGVFFFNSAAVWLDPKIA